MVEKVVIYDNTKSLFKPRTGEELNGKSEATGTI